MKKFENDYVAIWIDDDILFSNYKKQLSLDIASAKQIVKDRVEFTGGKSYFILIDFTNLKSTTKEARDYMNDPNGGLTGLLGGAFLSNNVVATLFVNLYLKVNNPAIPAKFFTNKAEAISWLKKVKIENNQLASI
ncbi:MAG: hypothetical protein ABI663_24095 [Chryseolinea sp.]